MNLLQKYSFLPLTLLFQVALSFAAPVSAASQTGVAQALDSTRSTIQVALESQLAQVDGKFNEYSGVLVVSPNDFTKSQMHLEFDLSKAKLNARMNGQAYPVDGLLSGMRVSKGTFQSSKITDKGNSRYLVTGVFVRGKNKRVVAVPVRLVAFNPAESRLEIAIDGPLQDLDSDIALPQLFGPTQAKVSGTLVFTAATAAAAPRQTGR